MPCEDDGCEYEVGLCDGGGYACLVEDGDDSDDGEVVEGGVVGYDVDGYSVYFDGDGCHVVAEEAEEGGG